MSILEKRSLSPAIHVEKKWKSSEELLGLAPSPDSLFPAPSTHQWEEGPPLRAEIPGRDATYTQDRLRLRGNRCQPRPRVICMG